MLTSQEQDCYTNWLELAHDERKKKNINNAISFYERSIENEGNHFLAHQWLGICLAQKEEFDSAIESLQKAFDTLGENDKRRSLLHFHLANVLAQKGLLEKALLEHKKAIELSPDFANAYQAIATVLDRLGRIDEAIEHQSKAATLDSSNSRTINFYSQNLPIKKDNLSFLAQHSVKVVSLGEDCLPRVISTRWGLKAIRAHGELSCPFDLSVHSYRTICELIENDFSGYLSPQNLETQSNSKVHFGIPFVRNKKDDCIFNHERGAYWSQNNFQAFVKRYEKRIENFYQYIDNESVLFVLHDRKGLYDGRLFSILETRFNAADFKLLVLNTSGKTLSFQTVRDREIIVDLPFPTESYQWSLERFYTSEAGIAFESRVATFMKNAMSEGFVSLFNVPVVTSDEKSSRDAQSIEPVTENSELLASTYGTDASVSGLGIACEKIWNLFNTQDFSLNDVELPEEITFAKAEAFFNETNKCRVFNVDSLSFKELEILKRLNLSTTHIKKNLLDCSTDTFELSDDNCETPPGFDDFHWADVQRKVGFQQSIVKHRCMHAVCPHSGEKVSSTSSFYAWNWTRGGMLFYRFEGMQEVFYIIAGGPWGQKCSLYLPTSDLLIHLTHPYDFFPNHRSINAWKAEIVRNRKLVEGYLKDHADRKLVAIVGRNDNIGHYLSNILSGLQRIHSVCGLGEIDEFVTVGSEFYGPIEGLFPELSSEKTRSIEQLNTVPNALVNSNGFAFRPGDLFITENLAARIRDYSIGKCSQEVSDKIRLARKNNDLLVWVTIRTGSRSWLNQADGIPKIFNELSKQYSSMGIVFNGFSRGEVRSGGQKEKDESFIDAENLVISEISKQLSSDISVYNTVGAMMHECVAWAYKIDAYLGPWGATLTNTMIANKPGVVHANSAVLNMPIDKKWGSWERENAKVPVYIAKDSIVEDEDFVKSNDYDTRPTFPPSHNCSFSK